MSSIVRLRGVRKRYGENEVLRGVDLDIAAGETVSIIGPSGSGKSTLLRLIMMLDAPDAGMLEIDGISPWKRHAGGGTAAAGENLRRARGKVGMVFQHFNLFPHISALGNVMEAPMRVLGLTREAAEARAREHLASVGLGDQAAQYPAQLSGGQRQRVAIARALVMRPEIVVCDEPTSALDVSVQSQILNLLQDLQRELGLTYIFISHNLAVVEHIASRVAVMYLGRIVEEAPTETLFAEPLHPYTQALLASVLTPQPGLGIPDTRLGVAYPNPIDPPSGCTFHPRCPEAMEACRFVPPVPLAEAGRRIECHLYEQAAATTARLDEETRASL